MNRVGQPARDRHTEGRRQRRCHIMPWRASMGRLDFRRIYQYDLIWHIDSVSFIASVIPANFAFTTTVWSRLSVFTFMTIAVLGCTSRESTRRARMLFERPREIYSSFVSLPQMVRSISTRPPPTASQSPLKTVATGLNMPTRAWYAAYPGYFDAVMASV